MKLLQFFYFKNGNPRMAFLFFQLKNVCTEVFFFFEILIFAQKHDGSTPSKGLPIPVSSSQSIFTHTKCTIQKSKTGQCNYSSSNKRRAFIAEFCGRDDSVAPVMARNSVCFLLEFFVWRFWRGCLFPKIAKPVSRFLWFLVRWRPTWTLSVAQLQSQFFPEKLLSTW